MPPLAQELLPLLPLPLSLLEHRARGVKVVAYRAARADARSADRDNAFVVAAFIVVVVVIDFIEGGVLVCRSFYWRRPGTRDDRANHYGWHREAALGELLAAFSP